MTNTQSQILQATRLLAMEITLLAPYSLAALPPAGCNGCLSGPLEPQGPSEGDRIPLSLPFFPGGDTHSGQDIASGPDWDRALSRCPRGWLAGTDWAHQSRAELDRRALGPGRGTGRAGKRGGAAGRGPGAAGGGSAGAGDATQAGGGLAARCSPAPRSLKAPFSRSAGSSPEEAGAT